MPRDAYLEHADEAAREDDRYFDEIISEMEQHPRPENQDALIPALRLAFTFLSQRQADRVTDLLNQL